MEAACTWRPSTLLTLSQGAKTEGQRSAFCRLELQGRRIKEDYSQYSPGALCK